MIETEFQIDSAAISDRGLSEKRPENEDSYVELRDSSFYAVADGVGGAQAGDVASQMAMEILGEAFINLNEGGDAEARMKAGIEQSNSAIFQMSHELHQLSTMATTVVGLHIDGNIATIAHVGDSRLYRIDPQGRIYQETQDHSVVEEEVRAGRLTPEQAATHPSRNVISRALGAEESVEIDLKSIVIEPGTSFLLCSDGVTRHITDEELRIIVVGEDDPFSICQRIKETCFDRGAEDNLTAIVVKLWLREVENDAIGYEEDTVASPRHALADSAIIASNVSVPQEKSGVGNDLSVDPKNVALDSDEEVENAVDLARIKRTKTSSDSIDRKSMDSSKSGNDSKNSNDVRTIRIDEDKTGFFGRLIQVLPWVLLLILIGIGIFYYTTLQSNNQPNEASPDATMNNYEAARRQADANPASYIASAAARATTPGDYYLLGRAYFLSGDYGSSKNQLKRATELLESSPQGPNTLVVKNDIEILSELVDIKTEDPNAVDQLGTSPDDPAG